MSLVAPQPNIWEAIYREKRRVIELYDPMSLRVSDFAGLQQSLTAMCITYKAKGLSKFIERITPSLDHVRSFASAISSAAQANAISTLVWAGLQLLIEMACRYSETLENIITLLADFNNCLPLFDSYLALFPNKPLLHIALSDMYSDYLDYCLAATKYLRRNRLVTFIKFGFSSSQQKIYNKAKQSLLQHKESFFNQAGFLYRAEAVASQLEHARQIRSLAVPQITLTPLSTSATSSRTDISWPVHNIQKAFQNFVFVGREYTINEIHETFGQPAAPGASVGTACCLLYGLGGVGKTSLARQYVHLHKVNYDAIFEVRADSDTEVSESFCQIAKKLHLGSDDDSPARMIEDGKNWLEGTNKTWLVLFDNVNDVNDLAPYWATNLKVRGSIIITSQKSSFVQVTDGPFREIRVAEFTPEQGAVSLFKYLRRAPANDDERAIAEKISDTVGGLPLAIATVAGYVAQSNYSLQDFYVSFNQSSEFWNSGRYATLGHYEKTLGTVFRVALGELDVETRRFLDMLAFLDPEKIPESILRIQNPTVDLLFLRHDNTAGLMHMTTALQGRQLVARHSDGEGSCFLSLHRALQWALIHELSEDNSYRQLIFRSSYEIVRRAIPEADPLIIPEPEKWPVYKKNLPHILSIARKAREQLPALDTTLEFAVMLNDITSFMWYEGHNDDCQRLAVQTESILDKIGFDPLSKIRWDTHVVVGILCSFTGVSRREEGFRRRNAAIKICEHFQKTFPDQTESNLTMLCISTADLAWAYVEDEAFDEAESLMQDCAKMYEKLGEEKDLPFHWGRFYHHRFYGKLAKGEYLEAIELIKHAADLQEAHSTANSTHTQDYRFALGEAVYHAGDIPQALTIHQGVLRARQHLHGEFNSGTMASYFATGMLHWINGDQEQAETNLRICLEPKRKSHWSEEQSARANFYLSKLLLVKGKQAEARELESKAAAVRDKLRQSSGRFLRIDQYNERTAYDLMVPMMSMRFAVEDAMPQAQDHDVADDSNQAFTPKWLHEIETTHDPRRQPWRKLFEDGILTKKDNINEDLIILVLKNKSQTHGKSP